MNPDQDLQANVNRSVGLAAVKKMSRLAARLNEEERRTHRFSSRALVGVAALLTFVALLAILRPDFVAGVLRFVSAVTGR
jgi:hypothetical protein